MGHSHKDFIRVSMRVGSSVLYKNVEDGWFYSGVIKVVYSASRFTVESNDGQLITCGQEDLIPKLAFHGIMEPGEHCMVEVWCHNTSCWCPAEVERANTSSVVTVMPNGSLDRFSYDHLVPISKLQYEQLRLFMSTREAQMRGKRVLAPRMAVGLFFNGTIKTKSEQLRKFLIWFANGDLEPVCLCHLILKPPEHAWAGDDVVSDATSTDIKGRLIVRGDAVLAPCPSVPFAFGPSKVFGIKSGKLSLVLPGNIHVNVLSSQCYLISKEDFAVYTQVHQGTAKDQFLRIPPRRDYGVFNVEVIPTDPVQSKPRQN